MFLKTFLKRWSILERDNTGLSNAVIYDPMVCDVL